jgi:hypothetical protein
MCRFLTFGQQACRQAGIPVLGTFPMKQSSGFFLFQYQTKKTELVDPSSAIQQFFNPFTDIILCFNLTGIENLSRQPTDVKVLVNSASFQ